MYLWFWGVGVWSAVCADRRVEAQFVQQPVGLVGAFPLEQTGTPLTPLTNTSGRQASPLTLISISPRSSSSKSPVWRRISAVR